MDILGSYLDTLISTGTAIWDIQTGISEAQVEEERALRTKADVLAVEETMPFIEEKASTLSDIEKSKQQEKLTNILVISGSGILLVVAGIAFFSSKGK